jgi:ribonuclease III
MTSLSNPTAAGKTARALQQVIGYSFTDGALLLAALTHRSAGKTNNERLEFLGDGILNFVIADEVYRRFPQAHEGELSRFRASLVNKPTLAEVAKSFVLGDYLQLGPGELKTGGHRRDSILADALEALLGAIYLDGGFEQCAGVIRRLYVDRWENLPDGSALKDPKSRLQEYLQSRKLALPKYIVIEVTGAEHERQFTVECGVELPERIVAQGRGSSRRVAEQVAAAAVVEQLNALSTKPAKRGRSVREDASDNTATVIPVRTKKRSTGVRGGQKKLSPLQAKSRSKVRDV